MTESIFAALAQLIAYAKHQDLSSVTLPADALKAADLILESAKDRARTARDRAVLESRLKQEALAGAVVELRPGPDGGADLTLDGKVTLQLRPQKAELMCFLLKEGGRVNVFGRSGWKRVASAKAYLRKQFGRPITDHAFNQLILRFRRQLRAAKANEYLLQRAGGFIRFEQRRRAPDTMMTGSDRR